MRTSLIAIAATGLLAAGAAHASSFTFQTLDNPNDPVFNQLLGINDAGTIAGYSGDGTVVPNKGYTIAKPYTRFVADNVPMSKQTQAIGINNAGVTDGFWVDGAGANHGFVRIKKAGGGFTFIQVNDPLTTSNPSFNQLLGINRADVAAGFYLDAAGLSHGYTYSVGTGAYTAVTLGNATQVAAAGINDNGVICGFFVNKNGLMAGFVKSATTKEFAYPKAMATMLTGINNMGQTVGTFTDNAGVAHGLYYNPTTGVSEIVDNKLGTKGNVLNGLNNMGQLVGFYTDSNGAVHGEIVTVGP